MKGSIPVVVEDVVEEVEDDVVSNIVENESFKVPPSASLPCWIQYWAACLLLVLRMTAQVWVADVLKDEEEEGEEAGYPWRVVELWSARWRGVVV